MPGVDLNHAFDLPPEEAIKYLEKKGLRVSWNWHDILGEAHSTSFTVAKMARVDLLRDTHDLLQRALSEGMIYRDFRKILEPRLKAAGWWGKTVDPETGKTIQLGSPHRMQTIFRTNMQSSYMAGRYVAMKGMAEKRPYWMYVAVLDSRTRPAHAALNGKVFMHDDPFWETQYPPRGYRCRCRARALSEAMLREKGLLVSTGEGRMVEETRKIAGKELKVTGWRDDAGNVHFADPGFDYNPGVALRQQMEDLLIRKVENLPPLLRLPIIAKYLQEIANAIE